jgi:hypothetical protein
MSNLICPQCATNMDKVHFNIGRYVIVRSFNCNMCGFNITDERYLDKCVRLLKYH